MKKTKQQRQLQASNAAHERLRKRNDELYRKTKQEKYQLNKLYHGHCICLQEKTGRVLTPREKEKAFDDTISTWY